MKNSIKTSAKSFLVVALFALAFTSCKKDRDIETSTPLSLQGAKAAVASVADTLIGNYGNPSAGPFTYGTVYADIITGAQDNDGDIDYHLLFSGFNNSTINPASGYTLKFLNSTKSLSAIGVSDFNNATPIPSLGLNFTSDAANTTQTATGWLNYGTGGKVAAVKNFIIFVSDGDTIYALKFNNAVGEGTGSNNRGVYYFDRGVV